MAEIVHARLTPAGPRFRVWSTVAERYATAELAERDLLRQLVEDECGGAAHPPVVLAALERADALLARARERGTSQRPPHPARPLAGGWDPERCAACRFYHHAFAPPRVTVAGDPEFCLGCGASAVHVAHGPACGAPVLPARPRFGVGGAALVVPRVPR